MRQTLLLLTLLSSACAPKLYGKPTPEACNWTVDRYDPMQGPQVDATAFWQLAELAQDVLDEGGLVKGEDFCKEFYGVSFRVHNTFSWKVADHEVIGLYWPIAKPSIELNYTGVAVAHELLHHWDTMHLHWRTSEHYGWNNNGFYSADAEFGIRKTTHLVGNLVPRGK